MFYNANMKLISDLHLEFWRDYGESLINEFPNGDLLIIAGDLCNAVQLPVIIPWLCDKYTDVVLVFGNHELYNHTPKQAEFFLKKIKNKNFHFLQNKVIEVQGYKIAGCTLWFKDDPVNVYYAHGLNDFNYITDFVPWVYNQNKKSINFLNSLSDVDIIVTHHVPSPLGIADEFKNSNLNRFFMCDMTDTILKVQPKYWFFGHTHFSFNFKVGETILMSNPRGYQHSDLNKNFTLEDIMGKSKDVKKEVKKQPLKTLKEKRQDKKAKK